MDMETGMNGMNRLAWCDGASRCESGNRAAAMLRPAPGRRSRGGAPGGALALLLALAVLALAVPWKAQAQAEVLVSNLNQLASTTAFSFRTSFPNAKLACPGLHDRGEHRRLHPDLDRGRV